MRLSGFLSLTAFSYGSSGKTTWPRLKRENNASTGFPSISYLWKGNCCIRFTDGPIGAQFIKEVILNAGTIPCQRSS
jgi:hypothetical protein